MSQIVCFFWVLGEKGLSFLPLHAGRWRVAQADGGSAPIHGSDAKKFWWVFVYGQILISQGGRRKCIFSIFLRYFFGFQFWQHLQFFLFPPPLFFPALSFSDFLNFLKKIQIQKKFFFKFFILAVIGDGTWLCDTSYKHCDTAALAHVLWGFSVMKLCFDMHWIRFGEHSHSENMQPVGQNIQKWQNFGNILVKWNQIKNGFC